MRSLPSPCTELLYAMVWLAWAVGPHRCRQLATRLARWRFQWAPASTLMATTLTELKIIHKRPLGALQSCWRPCQRYLVYIPKCFVFSKTRSCMVSSLPATSTCLWSIALLRQVSLETHCLIEFARAAWMPEHRHGWALVDHKGLVLDSALHISRTHSLPCWKTWYVRWILITTPRWMGQ